MKSVIFELSIYFGSYLIGIVLLFFSASRQFAWISLSVHATCIFGVWLLVGWFRNVGYRDWHYGNMFYILVNILFALVYMSACVVFLRRR